jgi:hypothetical protein
MEACIGLVFHADHRDIAQEAVHNFNFAHQHAIDYHLDIVELESVTPPSFVITPSLMRTVLPVDIPIHTNTSQTDKNTSDLLDVEESTTLMDRITTCIRDNYHKQMGSRNVDVADATAPLVTIWALLCRAYPDIATQYTRMPLQIITYSPPDVIIDMAEAATIPIISAITTDNMNVQGDDVDALLVVDGVV